MERRRQRSSPKSDNFSSSSSSRLVDLLKSSTGSSETTSTSSLIYEYDPHNRPPVSYSALIVEAIQSSPDNRLVLSEIYEYIQEHYPYFKTASKGWKNSIRHNLSLNKIFVREPQDNRLSGRKGSYWRIESTPHVKIFKRSVGIQPSSREEKSSRQPHNHYSQQRQYPDVDLKPSYPHSRTIMASRGRLPLILPRPTDDRVPDSDNSPLANDDTSSSTAGENRRCYADSSPKLLAPRPLHALADQLISTEVSASNSSSNTQCKQDVFLGAGTPKQNMMALDINSPIDSLRGPANMPSSVPDQPDSTSYGNFITFADLI